MHVRVALFARHRVRRKYARERAAYYTYANSCDLLPPAYSPLPPILPRSSDHPSAYPRSIRPMALLPPFCLLAPTTPGLFLGGSSIAPNHPHLPSCFSVPLKTPESSSISSPVPSFSLSSLLPLSDYRRFSRFFFIHDFSARFVRDKALHARSPSLSRPSIEINLYDIGMTPEVSLAPRFSSFDLRHRFVSFARACFRFFTHDRVESRDPDCSLMPSSSLSFRARSFNQHDRNSRGFRISFQPESPARELRVSIEIGFRFKLSSFATVSIPRV